MGDSVALPVVCLRCKNLSRAGARYCAHCGSSLSASAPPAALPATQQGDAASLAEQPRNWADLKQLLFLYLALLGFSLIFGWISRVSQDPQWDLIMTSSSGVVVLLFCAVRYRDVMPFLGLRLSPRVAAEVVGAALLLAAVLEGYFAMLRQLGIPMLKYSDDFIAHGWPIWSVYALISLAPALFEEIAFRGVLQGGLSRLLSEREGWIVQGILFSVLHMSPVVFPSHLLMGLLFGWVRNRTQSLYPGMLLHAVWNALVLYREMH